MFIKGRMDKSDKGSKLNKEDSEVYGFGQRTNFTSMWKLPLKGDVWKFSSFLEFCQGDTSFLQQYHTYDTDVGKRKYS